jgi:hypothetical protein
MQLRPPFKKKLAIQLQLVEKLQTMKVTFFLGNLTSDQTQQECQSLTISATVKLRYRHYLL